jgi:hypothetical protein
VTQSPPFRPGRLGLGVLSAFIGHAIVVAAALITGMVVKPSAGGGFEDLAAAGLTGLGGEAMLGLVCLVWGTLLFRHGERERGFGVVAGWLAGLAIFVVVVRSA